MAQDHLADAQLDQVVPQPGAVRRGRRAACLGHEGRKATLAATARSHAAQRLSLEGEHGARHAPASVELAHHVSNGYPDPVEEHLVEVGLAGELAQRPHSDPGSVHVDDEHRDALALRARRIGADEAGGEVAVLGA